MDWDEEKRQAIIESLDRLRIELDMDYPHMCIGLVDYLASILVTQGFPLQHALDDIKYGYEAGQQLLKENDADTVNEMARHVETSRQ